MPLTVLQPDGKLIVAGRFETIRGISWTNVARFYPDGTLDESFRPRVNDVINAMVVELDGRIIIAGAFTNVNGLTRNRIARLESNGQLDPLFNPNLSGIVNAVGLQSDGKILVGGEFTSVGGQSRPRLARLNTNGTLDTTFNANQSLAVVSLALEMDGRILIGGDAFLSRVNTNGSSATWQNKFPNSTVNTITIQPDGKAVVGGLFSAFSLDPRRGIARFNHNGSLDTAFNAVVSNNVYTVALQADGAILLGGSFTALNSVPRTRIGRLYSDGTLDMSFDTGTQLYVVNSLAQQADGRLLVGGYFTNLGPVLRRGLGRLESTGGISDQLVATETNVVWVRSGPAPAFWRTSLEVTTNGANWLLLGSGIWTNGNWQFPGIMVEPGATYRARGFVAGGRGANSGWFNENFLGPLFFTRQPVSRTNDAETTAILETAVAGESPFFQWYKDGSPIQNPASAHNPTLILTNVLGINAGMYHLVASNHHGSITSAVVTLTVRDPVFRTHPTFQAVQAGMPASLSAIAAGTTPLSYQWLHHGEIVAGATEPTFQIATAEAADAGNYRLMVSNLFGTATSDAAMLTVNATSLDPQTVGAVGTVAHAVETPSGEIMIGGQFQQIQGVPQTNVARLRPDLSLDPAVKGIATGGGFVIRPDGRIFVSSPVLFQLNHDGTPDLTFAPQSLAYSGIRSMAMDPAGRIIVGGTIHNVGGLPCTNLVRLNPDGAPDPSFRPIANNIVRAVALQRDGKILVGGHFNQLDGNHCYRLGRLNSDGTFDQNLNWMPLDLFTWANCIAVQPDDKILVGGNFSSFAGVTRSNLARLNPDGSLDPTFAPMIDGDVEGLALQSDGKILIRGIFSTVDGIPRSRIARLNPDGTLDSTLDILSGGGSVAALSLQRDGKILIGGTFTNVAGQPVQGFARLNNTGPALQSLNVSDSTIQWLRNGTGPEAWHVTFESSTNGINWEFLGNGTPIPGGWELTGITVVPGATIRARGLIAGGQSAWIVDAYSGPPAFTFHPLSRTNLAGTTATLSAGAGAGSPLTHQWYFENLPLSDGNGVSGVHSHLLVLSNVFGADAGAYHAVVSNAAGSVTSSVAQLTVIDPWVASSPVNAITTHGESVVFTVNAIGTPPLQYQWRRNGAWLLGSTGPSLTINSATLADYGGYDVIVNSPYGSATSAVAKLMFHASMDSLDVNVRYANVSGSDVLVNAVVPLTDERLYLGGHFLSIDSVSSPRLARLLADGARDPSFTGTANQFVHSIIVQPDSNVVVAGTFTTLSSTARTNIGRLFPDGTVDPTFAPMVGPSGSGVYSMLRQPDGKYLVAGSFSSISGHPRGNIARLNPDGSVDSDFSPHADGVVASLALEADGSILAGGTFTSMAGEPRSHLARLTPEGLLDPLFAPSFNDYITALAIQPDGKILVGGEFSMIGTNSCSALGRLFKDGSFDNSFNPISMGSGLSSVVLQADGKIIVESGRRVRRLLPNGAADGALDFSANGSLKSVSIQSDGKVIVGGVMTELDGEPRVGFARIHNTEPAVEQLRNGAADIVWFRSGTAPEVWHTAFDVSTNGIDWAPAGLGERIPGGWKTSGVTLTTNSLLRARGFVAGGGNNGSEWFVESTAPVDPHAAPAFARDGHHFGPEGFTLAVEALLGQKLVLEMSEDLTHWTAIQTNTAIIRPMIFTDPTTATNQRFYRVLRLE